uniref:Uncharacterized protein n=1 Tax=Cacopsylla melanoneura TaxID=428564 RepID=A0A8D9F6K2_9HEMI
MSSEIYLITFTFCSFYSFTLKQGAHRLSQCCVSGNNLYSCYGRRQFGCGSILCDTNYNSPRLYCRNQTNKKKSFSVLDQKKAKRTNNSVSCNSYFQFIYLLNNELRIRNILYSTCAQ